MDRAPAGQSAEWNRAADATQADPHRTGGESADLLTQVVDSLPVGLIYLEQGGPGVAANGFARNLLGLPSADLTQDEAARRLALLGVPPETVEAAGRGSDLSGEIRIGSRRYATRAFPVEGAWGRGTVVRIEAATDVGPAPATDHETARLPPASRIPDGVGHEFNNLLSRVICIAEDIQDERDVQVIHEFAETLIVTAERGAELVRRSMGDAEGAGPSAVDPEPGPPTRRTP